MDTKTKISTLWLFVLLNIIFRDLHSLIRPGVIEEMMTGYVNGQQITETLFIVGAIVAEIPIAMVFLSRVLKYSINRQANIIASVITILVVATNISTVVDSMFFIAVEIAAMLFIIRLAWIWKKDEATLIPSVS